MITARSSVVKFKPGYYPKLATVIDPIIRHEGLSANRSWNNGKRPPLVMTQQAIKDREYKARFRARERLKQKDRIP